MTETLEELMRSFSEEQREVLSLRLQGYLVHEVAERVGRTERTVHRVLSRARKRLQEMQDEELE